MNCIRARLAWAGPLALVLFAGLLGWLTAASGEARASRAVQAAFQQSAARPAEPPYRSTPERLARGRYLAESVAACFACHSPVNWKTPDARLLPGRKGAGAPFEDEEVPVRLISPNITPDSETGVGAWSDAELARAIREGVSRDGRRLFPIMPYPHYRAMSDEDLASLVVFLRSLRPVRNALPKNELPPSVLQTLPQLPRLTGPVPAPDLADPVARGAYLVRIADCVTCHTPANERGEPVMALAFSGGHRLRGPWGDVSASNLTPDPSGISYYDERTFLRTMRTGKVGGVRPLNPIMIWGYYRGMTDADLQAIFAYLRTLPPIRHRVDNTEPPTPCKVCGSVHGLGNRN